MDRIRRADLQQLLQPRTGPCLSLFMPMHPGSREATDDAVRLRELADDAEHKLIGQGLKRAQAAELLTALRGQPEDASWTKRGRGIAFFAAPGFMRTLHFHQELKPSLHVNDHFCVLPLLPLVTEEERFYLLALSQNVVRFFEGDAETLRDIPLPGAPANLAAAIDIEDAEHGVHFHSGMAGSEGKQRALYHGHGGKPEVIKTDLREFLQRVAPAVERRLNGQHAPLVLATVEATAAMWREITGYKFLLDGFVAGNPDHLTPAELHAKAWPLVQPALAGQRRWCERRLIEAAGDKVTSDLREIVPAAIGGRVSALFVDCQRSRWGQYDPANHVAVLHAEREPGDENLVERAAVETMRHGGDVFDLRSEEGGAGESAEALLRF
jgi:Bacterial archaeo-eukaryotic release factor family 7